MKNELYKSTGSIDKNLNNQIDIFKCIVRKNYAINFWLGLVEEGVVWLATSFLKTLDNKNQCLNPFNFLPANFFVKQPLMTSMNFNYINAMHRIDI
ncbi:hypothetical protein Q2T41_15900 [Maribacter confluentis]|uniref:Uncharacterized protein n=1 Tax=Maribacter confluentis TaxID=1656093 RepID=A0ABT8RT95_9FLAO|nr:hypothetical protein [Maribacter confluentis]MDO1514144.1 hypothetical protein [Maribacter confluentis]